MKWNMYPAFHKDNKNQRKLGLSPGFKKAILKAYMISKVPYLLRTSL